MPEKRIKPGIGSYLTVLGLLVEALLEVALLPVRLAVFWIRRKKARDEISRYLQGRRGG